MSIATEAFRGMSYGIGHSYGKPVSKTNYKQSEQPMNDHLRQIEREVKYGRKINTQRRLSFADHLRQFDDANPKMAMALGVTFIAGISAGSGALVGYGVDKLAHLTERKNEKVGEVVGAIVGSALAIGQLVTFFSVVKRLEMGMRLRDFSPDSKTYAGQSRQLIEDRCLPWLMATYNNAKSNLGTQHEYLRINDKDVRDSLNYIAKWNIPKDIWQHYLLELPEEPTHNAARFRAVKSARHVDIQAGKVYVSKYSDIGQFIESDWYSSFDPNHQKMKQFLDVVKVRTFPEGANRDISFSDWKLTILDDFKEQIKDKNTTYDNEKNITDPFYHAIKSEKFDPMLQKLFTHYQKIKSSKSVPMRNAYNDNVGAFKDENNDLYFELIHHFKKIVPDEVMKNRSWVRIDELKNFNPILRGLRPPTLYSLRRNLLEPLIDGLDGASNPNMQARNAGTSLAYNLTILGAGSALTVLVLGISSTPVVSSAVSEKPGNTKDLSNTQNESAPVPGSSPNTGSVNGMGSTQISLPALATHAASQGQLLGLYSRVNSPVSTSVINA